MSQGQERILVRGVNWLGDAVMTTPALLRLREAKPDAFIALLTPAKLADLWRHHLAVDAVVSFEQDEGVFGVARRLRAERFDTSLVLPNSPRSALESFLARIPRRLGYPRVWRNLFLTELVPPRSGVVRMRKRSVEEIKNLVRDAGTGRREGIPATAHQIHEYLHLVAGLGASPEPLPPQIVVTREEVATIRARFSVKTGQGAQPRLFGLNPGAEYGPAKRWPQDRFVQAAVELQRRTGCSWWILGGPGDRELADAIVRGVLSANAAAGGFVRSLTGQTSLRELCAALKACDVVLTNDTGPMHVAAAVGTPVVVPFGSTSPELTGPGLPGDSRYALLRSEAPCSPCFLRECPIDFRCMNGISVESVVDAVTRVAMVPRAAD